MFTGKLKKKLKKIGIGGIAGSGKSSICALLKDDSKYYILNLDELGHSFYESADSPVYDVIVSVFGEKVPGLIIKDGADSGKINRKALGMHVFKNKDDISALNDIFYKKFYDYVIKKAEELNLMPEDSRPDYFIIDGAVLFHSGIDKLMDYTFWVDAPDSLIIQRLVNKRGMGLSYAREILAMQKQMFDGCREKADFIIENSETFEKLLENFNIAIKGEISKCVN